MKFKSGTKEAVANIKGKPIITVELQKNEQFVAASVKTNGDETCGIELMIFNLEWLPMPSAS